MVSFFHKRFFDKFSTFTWSLNTFFGDLPFWNSLKMNFLMFIAVVVATVSANQNTVDPKMKAKVMELLTMDAKDMKHCMTDADCADSKDKPKCCDKMRLCGPADAHKMEMRSKGVVSCTVWNCVVLALAWSNLCVE